MIVRGTGDASGADARVDSFGKITVFDNPDGLAGEIRKTFRFSCGLHPAVVHPEDETVCGLFDYLLPVQTAV